MKKDKDDNENVLEMRKRSNVSGRMPEYPYKKEDIGVIEQIRKSLEDLEETYGKIFERVKIKEDAPFDGEKLADALSDAGIDIPVEWGTRYVQRRHIYFIHDNKKVDSHGKPINTEE